MVKNIASFGRNGVHDFLLLRSSAIVMACYILYLIGFCVFTDVNYISWVNFFSHLFTKVFTMIALFSLLVHAWIGLWQVLTDYIKSTYLRGALQLAVIITLLSYFFFGLAILWGV